MAEKYVDCGLYIGKYDLTGYHNSLDLTMSVEMLENTKFGAEGRGRKAGLIDTEISHSGYWQGNVGKTLYDDMALSGILTGCPDGQTEGDRAFFLRQVQSAYSPGASIGELLSFDVSASGSGDLIRGEIMGVGAKTITGNGSSHILGPLASDQTLYTALHVVSVSGTSPTLDLAITSDDNSGFLSGATRATFTQVTAQGSEWKTITGPVSDNHWRAEWTIGGTNPAFTIMLVAGIK